MLLSQTQHDFLKCNDKFTAMSGGYKAGKTFILTHRALRALVETRQDGLLAEPTYRMNTDLLRPQLEKTFMEWGIPFLWDASNSRYVTEYGKILLRTQDKRAALEGHNIGWFGLDEVDLIKKDKAEENWRTLISKLTRGKKQYGFITGTNEGFEFFYDKFYKDTTKIDNYEYYHKPDYSLFISSTEENAANLPIGYLDALYQDYDERLVDRYIKGKFITLNGMAAAYSYTTENYSNENYDPGLESVLTFDFNINPMSCILNQKINDKWHYTKEFVFYESNTTDTCDNILSFFEKTGFNGKLELTGDFTGTARKTAGRSDWVIIKEKMAGYTVVAPKITRTASVRDRLNAMNRGFSTKRQYVNIEKCPKLHEDLLRTRMLDSGMGINDEGSKRGHQLDACSYFDANYYPIRVERKTRSY